MIILNTLSFTYPSGGDVLTDISLHIPRGELVGLVGANGSGKSTLLSLIAGLYVPTGGAMTVADRVCPGSEKSIRAVCRLVMQDADLQILGGTVEEDMLMGRKRDEGSVARAKAMAGRFNLLSAWERPVQTLSWGMKRKLCLATALLDNPTILLLDEPLSGLDYSGVREMRAIIQENHQAGLTQIVSSHDLESFIDLVDSLAVLDAGRLVDFGPPESVLDRVRDHGVRPPRSWSVDRCIGSWDVVAD
ncbi:ATP-binding cassette domain-containing protein [Pseudodesulfovibrio sp. JC047]|uniref:energy-coupling factor ABC transporter ATP-binding protein n=1 Tax=Pseudodesulfovibrio sp. JC047 TaxID=2683199 RepID=UPI0013D804C2|nr:ABC transporter ATP-binding protein [Pseudodesulfovibrio sp. JC047]NDV19319.1 ATP-binding cassette domain-containing protein [Pseudodesulfovibrio sp. JC047]